MKALLLLCLMLGLPAASQETCHLALAADEPELVANWIQGRSHFGTPRPGARGAIVSHHLLVAGHIAGLFEALAASRKGLPTTRVILLSPDHFHRTSAPVTGSRLPWRTQLGMLEADQDGLDLLAGQIRLEDGPFLGEHGVGAVVPFVAAFFPHARLLPLMIRQGIPWQALDPVAEALARLMDEGTVILLSADFAHDAWPEQALALDRASLAALDELSTRATPGRAIPLTSCNRKGAYLFFLTLERAGRGGLQVLERYDSAALAGRRIQATSYIFALAGDRATGPRPWALP